jgi:hypothetical protein
MVPHFRSFVLVDPAGIRLGLLSTDACGVVSGQSGRHALANLRGRATGERTPDRRAGDGRGGVLSTADGQRHGRTNGRRPAVGFDRDKMM